MKRFLLVFALLLAFMATGPASGAYTSHAGEVAIVATGDILPHASWQPLQIPVFDLLEGAVSKLYEADIVIGNLESPLTDGKKPTPVKSDESLEEKEDFVFKAEDENTAKGLRDAGFTLLTLANNHILDFGEDGLLDTLDRLAGADIMVAGAGRNAESANRPCVVNRDGLEVVVLAASDVVPAGFEATGENAGIVSMKVGKKFTGQVRAAREFYPDALIVLSLHWGTEATYKPTPRQKKLARELVDAGADLIIGHHPHRIQGVEIYKDRPIFYSLGNFQFDTNEPGDETFIAKVVYTDGSRVPSGITVSPVKIRTGGFPVVLGPDSAGYTSIMELLDKLSAPFGVTFDGERLVPLPPAKEQGYDYWGA